MALTIAKDKYDLYLKTYGSTQALANAILNEY